MSEVNELLENIEVNAEESLEEALKAEFGDEYVTTDTSLFLQEEEESLGFLPEASANDGEVNSEEQGSQLDLEGTELDSFEAAQIEDVEFVEEERLESIIESILFASDRPVSLTQIKEVFKRTNVETRKIRRVIDQLMVEYAGGRRGVTLEEVPGGYQLRTKVDNLEWLRRSLKTRTFKLSGPALETLAIVAYKQPVTKYEVDEIRGVESGHLLRALMEKNLVNFQGKSDLPGRPMQYGTARKFLEIFGLRNLKELPTLSQIDEILPEGIGEEVEEKPTLSSITDTISEQSGLSTYSVGEDELAKIEEQLSEISTSSNFFEEEKKRQAEKRNQERGQNIREALLLGEPVATRDQNWLKKYDDALLAGMTLAEYDEKLKNEKMSALSAKNKKSDIEMNDSNSVIGADSLEAAIEEFEANSEADSEVDTFSAGEEETVSEGEEETVSEGEEETVSEGEEETFSEGGEDLEDELPFIAEADEVDESNGEVNL